MKDDMAVRIRNKLICVMDCNIGSICAVVRGSPLSRL
jgi:hypothetical protein